MNKLKYILTISFITTLNLFSSGQNKSVDEALEFLKNAEDKIEKREYPEAITFINKALIIAKETESHKIEADCRQYAGDVYKMDNKITLSVKSYLNAVLIYEKDKNQTFVNTVLTKLAHIYFEKQAYRKASEYFKRTLNKEITEEELLTNRYIGNCYLFISKYDSSLYYFKKSYDIAKKNDNENAIIKSLQNLAAASKKKNDYKKALEYNLESYELYLKNQNNKGMALIMNNIGYDFVHEKKYDEALASFNEALLKSDNTNIGKGFKAKAYTNIAICYQNKNDLDNTIKNLLKPKLSDCIFCLLNRS
ncbi:MAG: tetratricopeptide repeat protein [bacterium]|nr:tetratricopeptide repeat protein [bacterium]